MVGASQFTFRATHFTRYTVGVTADGVSVCAAASNDQGKTVYEKTRDVAFSDIRFVTVYSWQSRQVEGEVVYLQTRRNGTVMFMTSPTWHAEGSVSGDDRGAYFAATAAVFKALAAARPDLRIRNGRPAGWKIARVAFLALAAAVLSGLLVWQMGDPASGGVYLVIAVASIIAVLALYGIYRLKLLSPTRYAPVDEVAGWTAKRAPVAGPWGAPTAT
jgi:hypothetical protein